MRDCGSLAIAGSRQKTLSHSLSRTRAWHLCDFLQQKQLRKVVIKALNLERVLQIQTSYLQTELSGHELSSTTRTLFMTRNYQEKNDKVSCNNHCVLRFDFFIIHSLFYH